MNPRLRPQPPTKEYKVLAIVPNSIYSEDLQSYLNKGWQIERADSATNTIVYVLYKSNAN